MMAPDAPLKARKLLNINGLGEAWDPDAPSFRGVDLVNTRQPTDQIIN